MIPFASITDMLLAEFVYFEIGQTSIDATLAVNTIAIQRCLVELSASVLTHYSIEM